eukprot:1930044-Prorocentrum_lima.AAC.1
MHHNTDHRGVIMEIKTFCKESSMDQGLDHTAKCIGQVPTWKEHPCRWFDKGVAEGKAYTLLLQDVTK